MNKRKNLLEYRLVITFICAVNQSRDLRDMNKNFIKVMLFIIIFGNGCKYPNVDERKSNEDYNKGKFQKSVFNLFYTGLQLFAKTV